MHKMFRTKAYEQEYGPHFNEEQARIIQVLLLRQVLLMMIILYLILT